MTKVNRYNGQQRRTQNLAQRKKQHKPLEVGQTLTQPTADPKLKGTTGTIDFSQPKPVVTNPQNVSTADAIAQLNQQQEAQNLEKQQKNIERQLEKAQAKVKKNEKRVAKLEKEVAKKGDKASKHVLKQLEDAKKYLADNKIEVQNLETQLGNVKSQLTVKNVENQAASKTEAPKTEAPKAEAKENKETPVNAVTESSVTVF